MRISFTQSGGFAGLVSGCRIDTSTLDAAERATVEELVGGAGLDASCECLSDSCRDGRTYEIAIERTTTEVRAVFDDASLPEAVRPLVVYLRRHAKPQRPPR
jgi:hypothetical protein